MSEENEDMAGDIGADPAFEKALDETRTEYREALDRLDDKPDVDFRSAETGQFVSEEEAEANPETTVREETPATVTLNKRRVVMNLHNDQRHTDFVYFEASAEEAERTDGYYMTRRIWDDFGRPDVITVAVVPRDILN